jgi:hypothetical protein
MGYGTITAAQERLGVKPEGSTEHSILLGRVSRPLRPRANRSQCL